MKGRKPGAALWTALLLVAVALYPGSFGPAVWLTARGCFHTSTIEQLYWPILWSAVYGPDPVWRATMFWGSLCVSPDDAVTLKVEGEYGAFIPVPFWNADEKSIFPRLLRFKSRSTSRPQSGGVI